MGNVIIKLSLQYYYNKAICTIIARILVTVNLYLISRMVCSDLQYREAKQI